jgi:hypothetical protein
MLNIIFINSEQRNYEKVVAFAKLKATYVVTFISTGRNKNRGKMPQMAVELIDSIPYNLCYLV